jgi:ankyrin repeat protein
MTRAIERLCKHLGAGNIDAALTLIRIHDVLRGPILVRGFPIWQHCMMAAPSRIADFLAAGLHPDIGALSQGQTWLQYAASVNRADWIELLLQYGANVDQANMYGETALGYAVTYGNMEAARSLVDAGANVNYVEGSPEGMQGTILDNAQEARLIRYLRSVGAKYLSEMG